MESVAQHWSLYIIVLKIEPVIQPVKPVHGLMVEPQLNRQELNFII